MIVVADASPLNYLIQIECDGVLQKLYGRVLVPAAVIEELCHPGAPSVVANWSKSIPDWIEVRAIAFQPDSA
jgi:predicted nucleic acid-binding protein